MTRYSREDPRFAPTPCSWENKNVKPGYEDSDGLERASWARRKDCDDSQESGIRGGRYGTAQRSSPIRSVHQQRKRNGSLDSNGKNHKRSRGADAPQSISAWRYKELIQDNLSMALVDEIHADGCLLFEKWGEIETRLADMVADKLTAVPQGPNPLLDSSLVIRGHRVIRCEDGFSKIFLEDCIEQLADAWNGVRIKLVHASEIPSPSQAALEVVQAQQVQYTEETVENSLGWTLPRGAQLSDTVIQEIQMRLQNKRRGYQLRFQIKDGPITWKVMGGRGSRVRIAYYTLAKDTTRMEDTKQVEVEQAKGAHNTKIIRQSVIAHQAEEVTQSSVEQQTEVNSFGWIVLRGAEFSGAAIKEIKNGFLNKSKGQTAQFLVNDEGKSWRVTVGSDFRVRITEDVPVHTEVEQTEANSSNWIVPPGAELSEAAIQEIQARVLKRNNVNRFKFLEVHLSNTTEQNIRDKSMEMEPTGNTERSEDAAHAKDVNQTENVDKLDQSDWKLPPGAQLSNKAILLIQERIEKTLRKGRCPFLIRDGDNLWRVFHYKNQPVRIVPHNPDIEIMEHHKKNSIKQDRNLGKT
uniref:GG11993 n=1 Tax=Drosophila erecta TaxID=7220 RepID=B3P5B6_DROER